MLYSYCKTFCELPTIGSCDFSQCISLHTIMLRCYAFTARRKSAGLLTMPTTVMSKSSEIPTTLIWRSTLQCSSLAEHESTCMCCVTLHVYPGVCNAWSVLSVSVGDFGDVSVSLALCPCKKNYKQLAKHMIHNDGIMHERIYQ